MKRIGVFKTKLIEENENLGLITDYDGEFKIAIDLSDITKICEDIDEDGLTGTIIVTSFDQVWVSDNFEDVLKVWEEFLELGHKYKSN